MKRMPVLFVGHGNPMNAIEDNEWSRGFQQLATLIPKPKAILSVSAHWFRDRTLVTSNEYPRTIHDFAGFPDELYEIIYPVPGDLDLAHRISDLLGQSAVSLDDKWGIDHGTWSVLRRMYPDAKYPVIQLSINYGLNTEEHYAIGNKLKSLRNDGYLIMGSGNVTHNLGYAFAHLYRGDSNIPSWAVDFDEMIKHALLVKQHDTLLSALGSDLGNIAHPTPDHYLPLLYVAGSSDSSDEVTFPMEGFDMGSLSMRAVLMS